MGKEPAVHERSDGVEREDQQALYDRQQEERAAAIEERRVRLGHVEEKPKSKSRAKKPKEEAKKEEPESEA